MLVLVALELELLNEVVPLHSRIILHSGRVDVVPAGELVEGVLSLRHGWRSSGEDFEQDRFGSLDVPADADHDHAAGERDGEILVDRNGGAAASLE